MQADIRNFEQGMSFLSTGLEFPVTVQILWNPGNSRPLIEVQDRFDLVELLRELFSTKVWVAIIKSPSQSNP